MSPPHPQSCPRVRSSQYTFQDLLRLSGVWEAELLGPTSAPLQRLPPVWGDLEGAAGFLLPLPFGELLLL